MDRVREERQGGIGTLQLAAGDSLGRGGLWVNAEDKLKQLGRRLAAAAV